LGDFAQFRECLFFAHRHNKLICNKKLEYSLSGTVSAICLISYINKAGSYVKDRRSEDNADVDAVTDAECWIHAEDNVDVDAVTDAECRVHAEDSVDVDAVADAEC
jgi:hypothetical protein